MLHNFINIYRAAAFTVIFSISCSTSITITTTTIGTTTTATTTRTDIAFSFINFRIIIDFFLLPRQYSFILKNKEKEKQFI